MLSLEAGRALGKQLKFTVSLRQTVPCAWGFYSNTGIPDGVAATNKCRGVQVANGLPDDRQTDFERMKS